MMTAMTEALHAATEATAHPIGITPRSAKGEIGNALKNRASRLVTLDAAKERACLEVIARIFNRDEVRAADSGDAPMIAVIGGWAVFAKCGLRKSHDIDMAVNEGGWTVLQQMASENGWGVRYNPTLQKHEIKAKYTNGIEIDIDVYVGARDRLLMPPNDVLSEHSVRGILPNSKQWIRAVDTESLLAMKLMLSLDSARVKDPIDVAGLLTLLVPAPDMHKVGMILSKYVRNVDTLKRCLNNFSVLMEEMTKGTITFSSIEDQGKIKQMIEGLELELKEGALRRNNELGNRLLSDIFRRKES
jgi:hypothetical protein